MKLTKSHKNNLSKSKVLKNITKALICFALFFPLTFSSCSKDELDEALDENVVDYTNFNFATLVDGNFNMMSGGIISIEHKDCPMGFGINKLVDDSINTVFSTPYKSFYILWNGLESTTADYYTLTSANDRSMDPKSWTLYASNDTIKWDILDKQADVSFSANNQTKEFKFNNIIKYKYYKLEVQNNNGGSSTQIAEWRLKAEDVKNNPFSISISDQNTNMPTGGIITSQFSDSPAGMNIQNIVDAKTNSMFVTSHNSFYIKWEGSSSKAICYYSLTSSSTNQAMDPKSWSLSGSNDNKAWTAINTQSNQVFINREETKNYSFTNTTAYKYYMLTINSNNGGASTQIAEWSMKTKEELVTTFSATVSELNTNMPTGGIITSQFSDSPTGMNILNIVDAKKNSMYVASHNSFYIKWEGSSSKAICYYSLTSSSTNPTMDPKSWSLSGSNNGETWTALNTQTNQSFSSREETKNYSFTNTTAYKYYMLTINSNNGGASTQIAEWSMKTKEDLITTYSATVNSNNTNMPTGGTITSQFSDSPAGMNISSIVDAQNNTQFSTKNKSFYILWQGSSSKVVNYYTLTSAITSSSMDPKSWKLSGSNNAVSWTLLDTQTNQSFTSRNEKKGYSITNTTAYTYYKLEITSNNGGESTQIAEWTLQNKTVAYDITNLMIYSGGSSNSSKTPMGNHYENAHVTTASDKQWLSTASNEPNLLPSASSLTQYKEFPVTLYPYGKPQPADVNQHAIGDCCACSIFASFAYQYPDFIMNIIKDNGNKTYTVAMFDPQGKPVDVTVTSKFLANNNGTIGALTGKSNVATWSTVLEKALLKWEYIYKVNSDIGGIGSEHVAPLFTGNGNSYAFSANKLNSAQLRQAVEATLNQGKIVIGGFTQSNIWISGTHNSVAGHAFALMLSQKSDALFSMRNPWGGDDDGVYDIPNNSTITNMIDLRVIEPGKAANFSKGLPTPYILPYKASSQSKMRVTDELLISGK